MASSQNGVSGKIAFFPKTLWPGEDHSFAPDDWRFELYEIIGMGGSEPHPKMA
jgi:hypothetical protein